MTSETGKSAPEQAKDSPYSEQERQWLRDQKADFLRLKEEDTSESRKAALEIAKEVKKLKMEREPERFGNVFEFSFDIEKYTVEDNVKTLEIGNDFYIVLRHEGDDYVINKNGDVMGGDMNGYHYIDGLYNINNELVTVASPKESPGRNFNIFDASGMQLSNGAGIPGMDSLVAVGDEVYYRENPDRSGNRVRSLSGKGNDESNLFEEVSGLGELDGKVAFIGRNSGRVNLYIDGKPLWVGNILRNIKGVGFPTYFKDKMVFASRIGKKVRIFDDKASLDMSKTFDGVSKIVAGEDRYFVVGKKDGSAEMVFDNEGKQIGHSNGYVGVDDVHILGDTVAIEFHGSDPSKKILDDEWDESIGSQKGYEDIKKVLTVMKEVYFVARGNNDRGYRIFNKIGQEVSEGYDDVYSFSPHPDKEGYVIITARKDGKILRKSINLME